MGLQKETQFSADLATGFVYIRGVYWFISFTPSYPFYYSPFLQFIYYVGFLNPFLSTVILSDWVWVDVIFSIFLNWVLRLVLWNYACFILVLVYFYTLLSIYYFLYFVLFTNLDVPYG